MLEETVINFGHRIKCKECNLSNWIIGSTSTEIQFWNYYLTPRRTVKTGQENEETAKHPWTASTKGRCRSLVCSEKTRRKGSVADRSSLRSRNYKTGGRAG